MLIVGMCAPGRALTISARPTMASASRRSGLIGRAALDSTRMSTEGGLRGLDLLSRASTPLIPHPNTSCYTCLRTRDPPVRRYKSRRSLISQKKGPQKLLVRVILAKRRELAPLPEEGSRSIWPLPRVSWGSVGGTCRSWWSSSGGEGGANDLTHPQATLVSASARACPCHPTR